MIKKKEGGIVSTIKLGRLEEVDVRKLWSHEQYDFSNWLAKDENIELLNEVLGLTLVDIEKEVFVGSYRCDLVACDETTNQRVIIENQLEASNHDHLGKIVTYASGLNANVIVWIVKEAREEHRSAVEWLNNNTNKNINFFLIEIHAYRIGDSLYAPKFEVVEKPNDFIKNAKIQTGSGELNKSQSERLVFWTRFNEMLVERGKPFNVRTILMYHIEEDHEPIIDIDTWEAVQKEIERRSNYCKEHFTNAYARRSEVNPLYTKIICGNCSHTYSRVKYTTRAGTKITKWRCGSCNMAKGHKVCSNRYVTEESLMKLFVMSWTEIAGHLEDYKEKWQENIASEDVLLRYKTRLLMQYAGAGEVKEFDAALMMAVMDHITVFEDGRLQIKFYDGTEFEIATE